MSVYIAWSDPGEANRDLTVMDNRFSTMTEVRGVLWPDYEEPRWADPNCFQQGIAGSLELFFWAWVQFQQVVEEATGQAVPCSNASTRRGLACHLTSASSPTLARCSSSVSAAAGSHDPTDF